MKLAKVIQLELAMLCWAALVSCGGDIGVPVSTPVTGYISKGPVDGATCSLYNLSHQVVAGPVISNKGMLDFGKITVSGALTIECTGGTYTDEVTGQTANSGTLNSGVTVTQGTPVTGVVTPLTHMAYTRAAGDATQIAAKAKEVADAMGLSDVDLLATTPIDVNTQAADNDAAGKYGTMLAIVSQYMKDNNLDLTSAVTLLTNAVDTTGVSATMQMSLQTSVTNLATSGKAKDNVAKIKDDVKNAIKRGTGSGLSLTAASPAGLIQGAPGSSNWTIAGTGFLKSGSAVVIKLDGTACASSGTVISFVTIAGVDCSNVITSPTATTATLSLTANATGSTAQPLEQMLSIKLTAAPAPTITFTNNPISIQLGKAVSVVASSNSSGAVTYSGSNDAIATVSAAGLITPVALGKITVTATQAAVQGQYASGSKTYELTITNKTVPTLIFANSSKTVTLGEADLTNTLSSVACTDESNYAPTITYASSDTTKATVDSSGKVVLKAAGDVSIMAIATAHGVCATGSNQYTLTISKATPIVAFNKPTTIATIGTAITNIAAVSSPSNNGSGGTLPSTANLTFTYTSSNTAVATVSSTGLITPLKEGNVTITAKLAKNSNYNDIGASYQLTVNKAIPTLSIAPSLSLYLIDDALGSTIAALLESEAGNGLNKPTGSVSYSSSNPAVATVDSTGKILPISPGTATIIAYYAGDANYANKESQSTVTVLGATTANFIGVNWADRRDNFVDDLLLLSGLSANDNQATITAKTATIVAGFKATGANTLRLPVNPTTVLQSYWPTYSSIIDQASNNNMKVLVAYWEGASSKDGLVDGDGSAFWSMWDTLVAKYKDNPKIYFEVMNEPYGYDITSLKNLYVDWLARYPSLPRGRIVLGGARYSENVNAIGADTRFAECRLSFHFHVWWRNYWSVAEWETPIRDYVNYPQRTILTEFGIPVQYGDDFWTVTTSPTKNIAFMQGITNSVRTKNMGSIYWPGLRTNDSYSIFTYNGASLDIVNASALRRAQYGWGLP